MIGVVLFSLALFLLGFAALLSAQFGVYALIRFFATVNLRSCVERALLLASARLNLTVVLPYTAGLAEKTPMQAYLAGAISRSGTRQKRWFLPVGSERLAHLLSSSGAADISGIRAISTMPLVEVLPRDLFPEWRR